MIDVCVMLCTWNNSSRLRITLDAIAQCEVPEGLCWELVLVNNNCTDDTDAVAAEFAERLPNSYFKNRAVWERSLKDRGVRWADHVEVDAASKLVHQIGPARRLMQRSRVQRLVQRLHGLR